MRPDLVPVGCGVAGCCFCWCSGRTAAAAARAAEVVVLHWRGWREGRAHVGHAGCGSGSGSSSSSSKRTGDGPAGPAPLFPVAYGSWIARAGPRRQRWPDDRGLHESWGARTYPAAGKLEQEAVVWRQWGDGGGGGTGSAAGLGSGEVSRAVLPPGQPDQGEGWAWRLLAGGYGPTPGQPDQGAHCLAAVGRGAQGQRSGAGGGGVGGWCPGLCTCRGRAGQGGWWHGPRGAEGVATAVAGEQSNPRREGAGPCTLRLRSSLCRGARTAWELPPALLAPAVRRPIH